jgi:hypothetical protein
MPDYHQMGHASERLLAPPLLSRFRGAILSPVNYPRAKIAAQVAGAPAGFETIFDPQLYYPKSDRGHLRAWKYFPQDVDTADLTSDSWWNALTDRLVESSGEIEPSALCSPAVVPKTFDDDFFARLVRTGHRVAKKLHGSQIQPIQTAVVGLADLAKPKRSLAVASILSQTDCDRIYLVLVGTTNPRRELGDAEEIKGAMKLIAALQTAGLRVVVGFCSSDLVLWKAAGAFGCATGKFFNLRRFTASRFAEPAEGGGQLPYWFEESLLAYLRESDLVRVRKIGMLCPSSLANPFGVEIMQKLETKPGTPWVALGWRQFMYWFAHSEERVSEDPELASGLLENADSNWKVLDQSRPPIFMEERQNDGVWLRTWRRALLEFESH